MATTKLVRFFEPTRVDQNDNVKAIGTTFWKTLLGKLGQQPHTARMFGYAGTDYYGEAKLGKSPAIAYLYAGRLRDRDDWPDNFDAKSGQVTPLQLPGLLVEPTFVVPFGTKNYCAVMTPRLGGIRPTALESWLTAACGLTTTGDRIELRPLIDTGLAAKLHQQAVGVTKLSVRFPAGTDLTNVHVDGDDGGDVGEAIQAAAQGTTAEMSAEVVFSLGHSRGNASARQRLLRAARWVASHAYADKATVSMLLPQTDADGETLRSETHNLIKDRIAYRVPLPSLDGQAPTEESVLRAIQEAIDQYRLEH